MADGPRLFLLRSRPSSVARIEHSDRIAVRSAQPAEGHVPLRSQPIGPQRCGAQQSTLAAARARTPSIQSPAPQRPGDDSPCNPPGPGVAGVTSPRDKRIKNRWFIGASSEKLAPRPGAASSVQRVFTQCRKGSRCIQNSQPTISPTFSSTLPNLKSPTLKHIGALPSQHPRDKWNIIGPWSFLNCLIN
jgi:hypothetical protein